MMTWNPFDWTAGPFLSLYAAIAIFVLVWGYRLKATIGPTLQIRHQLNALELAYLAGGAGRLGDAVLLSLTSGHGAVIDAKGGKINVTDRAPLSAFMGRPSRLAFERDMTRKQFQQAIAPVAEQVQRRLQTLGYAPSDAQMTAFRTTVLPFVALVLIFGIAKMTIGAERHHPVGFLFGMVIFTTVFSLGLFGRPTRTRAGNDALRIYRASHARAARAPLDHELIYAVALSGPVVLSGTQYAPIYAASQTMSGGGGDGGGGGCGGGGGGGGGCGGCSG
jgi:uncharacterized protein (TIGR04222 family)